MQALLEALAAVLVQAQKWGTISIVGLGLLHTRLWKLILVSEIVFFSGSGVDSNRI